MFFPDIASFLSFHTADSETLGEVFLQPGVYHHQRDNGNEDLSRFHVGVVGVGKTHQ